MEIIIGCLYYLEQILEAPTNKISFTVIYLPSRGPAKKDVILWNFIHGHTSAGRQAETYIYQLCSDTWCHLKDLSSVMAIGIEV